EQQADEVLLPLRDRLDLLQLRDIQQQALPRLGPGPAVRLLAPEERGGDAWVIEAQPVFLLTQDRRAVVLESLVRVFDGEAKDPLLERAVRVVSPPVQGNDVDAYWRADAAPMTPMSAALMAEGLRTALVD